MATVLRLGLSLIASLALHAQTAPREVSISTHDYTPPSAILHVQTNLVETGVAVRDSGGHTVGGMQASDFEVLDNNVARPITAFSEVRADAKPGNEPVRPPGGSISLPPVASLPAQPKYVTFFFDDLHLSNANMAFVKQGARAYVAKGVGPGDHLSIVTATGQGDLEFTTDAKVFADALEHLGAHVRPIPTLRCGVSPIDSYIYLHNLDGDIHEMALTAAAPCVDCSAHDGPTNCRMREIGIASSAASTTWEQMQAQSIDTLDAMGFAAKRLSEVKGTRVLVLTSQGFLLPPGHPPVLDRFIDGALRWNIAVDAIGAEGLDATLLGRKALLYRGVYAGPLEEITMGTGGFFFRNSNDLAGEMTQASNPEVSYLLAFQAGAPDGKFHNLKIRFATKRAGEIQFRPGYFSPEVKLKPAARARMDDAVFTRQALKEIAATATVSTPQAGAASILINVDVSRLGFTSSGGRHDQQLVFLTTLLDSNGVFVTGKESIMELALTDERLAQMKKDGLKAGVTLTAPTGAYQVRTIVREGMKGALFADSAAVELHGK